MTDVEKVIKGLESCVKADWEVCMNKVCPYAPEESYNFACCRYKVMKDALELLKEQKAPVEPFRKDDYHYYCGVCGLRLSSKRK